jgi:hypothetical protein
MKIMYVKSHKRYTTKMGNKSATRCQCRQKSLETNITVIKQQFTQKSKLTDGYLLYIFFFPEK